MKNKRSKFKQIILERLQFNEQEDPSFEPWNNSWISGNDGDGNTVEFSGQSSLAVPGCIDPCADNFSPAFKYTYIPAGTDPDFILEPSLFGLNPFTHLYNISQMINPDTTNAQVAIHEFNSEGGTQVNIDCSGNAIQSTFGPVIGSAENAFIPILFKSYGIVSNGDNLTPFCFNPDTELQDTGLYPAGGASYGEFVLNSGQYQTEQLQNSNFDISCCNYSKPYLATLQGDGSVSYKPDSGFQPASSDSNLETDPSLGIEACQDYCDDGGWELVPNIGNISEDPEPDTNACTSELECLQGCIANGAQNPQLWCSGGQEQSLQQTNPLKQRMKKLAGIKEQEEIEPIGGETKTPNEFAYFDFKSWAYEFGTKELFRETKFKGPKGDIEYTLEEATEMGAGIMFFVLTQIWTLWTEETDNDQFGRIKDENINDFGKALYKMMKEDGKGFFFKGDERGAKVGDDAEYLKQRYGVEMNENISKERNKQKLYKNGT